jgi:hypothetical protein
MNTTEHITTKRFLFGAVVVILVAALIAVFVALSDHEAAVRYQAGIRHEAAVARHKATIARDNAEYNAGFAAGQNLTWTVKGTTRAETLSRYGPVPVGKKPTYAPFTTATAACRSKEPKVKATVAPWMRGCVAGVFTTWNAKVTDASPTPYYAPTGDPLPATTTSGN